MSKIVLAVLFLGAILVRADDLKEELKKTGRSIKQTAKDIGHKSKEGAHEVGDGFKKGWRKLKSSKAKDSGKK